MNRSQWLTLPLLLLMTAGCVVAPGPSQPIPAPYPSTYPSTYPSAYPLAYPTAYPNEYVPPLEYVVDGPVYYDTYPSVPFYPIFIDTPGSCFCVMPMRYVGGVWFSVTGAVIYRGFFPFRRIEPVHRTYWLQNGGVVNGMRPSRGAFEPWGDRMVPAPPPGSLHHRAMEQQRVNRPVPAAPAAVPPPRTTPNQMQQAPVVVPQSRPAPTPPPTLTPIQPQQQALPQQPQFRPPQQHPQPRPQEMSPGAMSPGATPPHGATRPESRPVPNESKSRSDRCHEDDKRHQRC